MNIPALHADETPHSAIGYRASCRSYPRASAGLCGLAQTTAPRLNSDGLVLLQAQRLVLLTEAARLRNLRRNKAASLAEAELRAVTHRILAETFPGKVPQ